jgi:hypothetical protein
MKWFPVDFSNLNLTNTSTGTVEKTCLTKLIKERGYFDCAKLFGGAHKEFTVKGVRK